MRVAVDCHMVGQPKAGDAGNARFHTLLTNALHATRGRHDHVEALIAHAKARALLDPMIATRAVPSSNIARLAFRVPRALANGKSDAAIFSYVTPLRTPCPVAVVIHDVSFRLHPEWFSTRVRLLLGALVPRSARHAAMVITVSERSKADLVNALGIDPARIRVVSNVPAPAFVPKEGAADRVAETFGLRDYCLYVGDVHPRKNLAALAQAISLLGHRRMTLAIVGQAGHRGSQIITQSGARWLGPVGDEVLADLYRAATVTCYPSRYEGFGLPVIEAMACGSPVVASNRGAIPEVAGHAAILVEPTPSAIAEGLRAALEPATADQLRAAGLERAAMFTPRAMGEAAWSAIRELK